MIEFEFGQLPHLFLVTTKVLHLIRTATTSQLILPPSGRATLLGIRIASLSPVLRVHIRGQPITTISEGKSLSIQSTGNFQNGSLQSAKFSSSPNLTQYCLLLYFSGSGSVVPPRPRPPPPPPLPPTLKIPPPQFTTNQLGLPRSELIDISPVHSSFVSLVKTFLPKHSKIYLNPPVVGENELTEVVNRLGCTIVINITEANVVIDQTTTTTPTIILPATVSLLFLQNGHRPVPAGWSIICKDKTNPNSCELWQNQLKHLQKIGPFAPFQTHISLIIGFCGRVSDVKHLSRHDLFVILNAQQDAFKLYPGFTLVRFQNMLLVYNPKSLLPTSPTTTDAFASFRIPSSGKYLRIGKHLPPPSPQRTGETIILFTSTDIPSFYSDQVATPLEGIKMQCSSPLIHLEYHSSPGLRRSLLIISNN